jgi:hypothetical protein
MLWGHNGLDIYKLTRNIPVYLASTECSVGYRQVVPSGPCKEFGQR